MKLRYKAHTNPDRFPSGCASMGDRHEAQSTIYFANSTLVLFTKGFRLRVAGETVGKSSKEYTHTVPSQQG
jgi:hypothetical protein